MKTIIAGSRSLPFDCVRKAMQECGWTPTIVVSGNANGVDLFGEQWAMNRKIPIERYPANWKLLGKRAGYIRNEHMATNVGAEALVAVWDGESRGTKHMIDIARRKGLRVFVWNTPKPSESSSELKPGEPKKRHREQDPECKAPPTQTQGMLLRPTDYCIPL